MQVIGAPASSGIATAQIPTALRQQGPSFEKLARLGDLALKAINAGDSLAAVQATGMTPELARKLLESAAALVGTPVAPVGANPEDPKSVIQALTKTPSLSLSITTAQLRAVSAELVAMVDRGESATAVKALLGLKSGIEGKSIQVTGGMYGSYNDLQYVIGAVRDALVAKGIDPSSAGVPQQGPIAM